VRTWLHEPNTVAPDAAATQGRLEWNHEHYASFGEGEGRNRFIPLRTDPVANVLRKEWALHLMPVVTSRPVNTFATPLGVSPSSPSSGL
jgi:hypothetical protein